MPFKLLSSLAVSLSYSLNVVPNKFDKINPVEFIEGEGLDGNLNKKPLRFLATLE